MLRILAGVSLALLIYEGWTLLAGVLLPLLANANALQTDFHYYYEAAVRFRADPAQLYRLSDDVIAGFAYPPPAILPFAVLSLLPLGTALLVLTIASYGAVLASVALWMRYLNHRGVRIDVGSAIAAGLVAVALGPTYSNAVFGQVNAFVLLCAVGFVTIGPARPAAGGALLAAGIWLKIYPVLLAAIGLWNRSAWRRIAYALLAAVVVLVVSLLFLPLASYQTFLNEVLPARFDKTAIHITNQSMIAFVERFFVAPEQYLNWTGEQAITSGEAVRAFNWIFGVAVIALLWRRAGHGARVEAVDSAAAITALAAVIAPLGWGHTFVLVLPLVVLHLVQMREASHLRGALVCACALAMLVPAGRRFGAVEQLAPWIQNVFYSRYLLATLVLIALPPVIARQHGRKEITL